jgi:DNA repair exonuclease SbcCD ATPase subunit
MTSEIKVTECWMDYDDQGHPSVFEERSNFSKSRHDHYKQAVILWREDYDALLKERDLNVKAIHGLQEQCSQLRDKYAAANRELEEWRQFKGQNKAMWQGAVKLIAEEHDAK